MKFIKSLFNVLFFSSTVNMSSSYIYLINRIKIIVFGSEM